MTTKLAVDDRLLAEAKKLGRHRTAMETVTAALDEYVRRRKQQQIISLFGTIDYDEGRKRVAGICGSTSAARPRLGKKGRRP